MATESRIPLFAPLALTFTFMSWVHDDERDEDDDGPDEVEFVLPGKYHVCPACEGKGTLMHVEEASKGVYWERGPIVWTKSGPTVVTFPGVAITEEDRDRDWSPDEWEQYTSGGYDVTCETCKGLRVVLGPDREACARNADDKATLHRYDTDCAKRDRDRRQQQREWEMGY